MRFGFVKNVFDRLGRVGRNIREMGVLGTLRHRYGRRTPEFQILTSVTAEEAPVKAEEERAVKKVRGL